jgi:hypothetical protein
MKSWPTAGATTNVQSVCHGVGERAEIEAAIEDGGPNQVLQFETVHLLLW